MRILGLGGLDHDGAAAIVEAGRVAAFLEAERVVRRKSAGLSCTGALEAVLDALDVRGADAIAVADRTFFRERGAALTAILRRRFPSADLSVHAHHDCHAFAALSASPWEQAVVITIDGKGDGLSSTAVVANRAGLRERLFAVPSRSSLGRLWWALSEYCGLPGHHSAGKTMALAAYGAPSALFDAHVELEADGGFRLEPRGLHPDTFRQVPRIVEWLAASLGRPPGAPHADAAASLQRTTERVAAHLVSVAVRRSGLGRVCLSGGVALNGLSNQRLLDDRVAGELFVPPCTDDRGLALGAAALLAAALGEPVKASGGGLSPFLGPPAAERAPPSGWTLDPEGLPGVAARLAAGAVIASFAGRDEAGPRALGHRSILATPVMPWMRDHLNAAVKRREPFRPFGCAIKLDRAADFFHLEGASPYMLRIARARTGFEAVIPSALHVDGTSRIQTVSRDDESGLWPLLCQLEALRHPPIVINTSLNCPGEPMAHTLAEASNVAVRSGLRTLLVDGDVYVR